MKKRILLIFGMIVIFVLSCGGKHAAIKSFEEDMKKIQNGEAVKIKLMDNASNTKGVKLFSEGYSKITYKINKTEVKNDTATINVTMKSPDLSGVVEEMTTKMLNSLLTLQGKSQEEIERHSQEVMASIIKEKLSDANIKYREKTFDVVYRKNADKWEADPDQSKDFIDMLTLGVIKVN